MGWGYGTSRVLSESIWVPFRTLESDSGSRSSLGTMWALTAYLHLVSLLLSGKQGDFTTAGCGGRQTCQKVKNKTKQKNALCQYRDIYQHKETPSQNLPFIRLSPFPPAVPFVGSLTKYRKCCVNSKLPTSHIIWD